MANILFVVPIGQDMGGIITSTEQYVQGFREAGHVVTPICAVFTKTNAPVGPPPRGKYAAAYTPGAGTGWLLHPTAGWRSEQRVSLACPEGVAQFKKLAKAHDVVIWASVYGFRNDATEGNVLWLEAIKAAKGRNVFMIHDDHMPARYPWGMALAKYAAAFVGVQPCSYDSLVDVAAPRAMVYTPIPAPPRRVKPIDQRSGFLSCQVWKTWKRADALVAAAPYMPRKSVQFAGDGIQLRYMRSPDKCPPRYAGLWDAAMKTQTYLGVVSEDQRDDILKDTKFLVDLSLRNNSGQLNRVVQEAMAQGCVVIANPKFITGTDRTPLFLPDVHYLPISEELYDQPKKLAAALTQYDSIEPKRYAKIQKAARAVLPVFDRAELAAQLADIGMGCGNAERYAKPSTTKVSAEANAAFKAVFGEVA